MQPTPEFIARLQIAAKRGTWAEQQSVSVYDHSGGNYDDAYYGGFNDGETVLARGILEALNIAY